MKKDQIIESARKLFNKYGFKKVSMDEIARDAGVTKRTVYMHFSSKEELFNYFINEHLLNMKKIVEEIQLENLDFYESIHQVIYRLLQYKHKTEFFKTIVEEGAFLKNPVISESIKTIDNKIQEYILENLKWAVNKGYITVDNPELTAFLIYKMYIALMFDWTEFNSTLDESIIADNILNILKNGLGKKDV